MDQKAWKKVDKKWNGDVSSVPDLRGYGALIHPKCQLTVRSMWHNGSYLHSDWRHARVRPSREAQQPSVFSMPWALWVFLKASQCHCSSSTAVVLLPNAWRSIVSWSGSCLWWFDTLTGMCPTCVHGTCNPVTGKCACDPKWRGNDCDQDVNECDLHTDNCDPIGTCANQSPGFTCCKSCLCKSLSRH